MDSGRPLKRPKVFKACDNCVSAKTRCEELTDQGCRRCRQRSKACSLIYEIQVEPDSYPSHKQPQHDHVDHITLSDQTKRIESLENRISQLEAVQLIITTPVNDPTVRTSASTSINGKDGEREKGKGDRMEEMKRRGLKDIKDQMEKNAFMNRWDDFKHMWFQEGIFGFAAENGYPNVISLGLINEEQVEMYCQGFKHHFTRLLPFRPFLDITSNSPKHPFVLLSILVYMRHLHDLDLSQIIDQSLQHVSRGAISIDVILALLILSLTPLDTSLPRLQPTAFRLISLAFSIGMDMGLEQRSESGLRDVETLYGLGSRRGLDDILLWETVKRRYNILRLMHSPNILPVNFHHLPDHDNPLTMRTIQHLRDETRMIRACDDLIRELTQLEKDVGRIVVDLSEMLILWDGFETTVEKLREERGHENLLLQRDSQAVILAMSIRITGLIQSVPWPVSPVLRRPAFQHMGMKLLQNVRRSSSFILSLSSIELRCLPSYLIHMHLIATFVAHRAHAFLMQHRRPVSDGMVESALLIKTEERFRSMEGAPKAILEHMEEQFGKLGVEEAGMNQTDGWNGVGHGEGFDPMGLAGWLGMDGNIDWEVLFGTGMVGGSMT
ncbi:hypothetical protein M231_05393 [Tremella mesenterica]|uniref:Zn(2)-C6 fungal-type domain-containing protein n=1 Tax=Tremella mesenterica TaxID=5217 RepID=A0A4V1M3L9_TREME|nr:hypothetical protein M231_05393 [Tremella mesenterica]